MLNSQINSKQGSSSAINESFSVANNGPNETIISIDDIELKGRDSPRKSGINQLFNHLCCCTCFTTEHNNSKHNQNFQNNSDINGKRRKVDVGKENNDASNALLSSQLAQNTNTTNDNNSGFRDINDHDSQISDDQNKVFRIYSEREKLLPPLTEKNLNKKCFIIDLDETLVHSSFKYVKTADINVTVEIDGNQHEVFVCKRPFVDEFLAELGDLFECVLFTASLEKYADPVTDFLDPKGFFETRLFREACAFKEGNYVKDLHAIGRDIDQIIILDNSPVSYLLNPRNALQIVSWFDDPTDTALKDLIPYFKDLATSTLSVSDWLESHKPPETAGILGYPPSNLHWILMQTLSVPESLSIFQQRIRGDSCQSSTGSGSESSNTSRHSLHQLPSGDHHEQHLPHHGMITQALKTHRRKSQAALDDESNRPPVSSPVARPSSAIHLEDEDDLDNEDNNVEGALTVNCEISNEKILYHSKNEDSSLDHH